MKIGVNKYDEIIVVELCKMVFYLIIIKLILYLMFSF